MKINNIWLEPAIKTKSKLQAARACTRGWRHNFYLVKTIFGASRSKNYSFSKAEAAASTNFHELRVQH